MTSVAVVGAGIAGLRSAELLRARGFDVVVFDKGRGPGGRTASRWREAQPGQGASSFDHGAQYFTARGGSLSARTTTWADQGIASTWDGRVGVYEDGAVFEATPERRWVGIPSMRAMALSLASDLDVRRAHITAVERESGAFRIWAHGEDLGLFERLVVTAPAPQAAPLLNSADPQLSAHAASVEFAPTWAVMLELEETPRWPYDAGFVNEGLLAWWCIDSSKPKRPPGHRLVAHLGLEGSQGLLDARDEEVIDATVSELQRRLGPIKPSAAWAHRWRFARPSEPLRKTAIFDGERRIAVAGDWTGASGRLEAAWDAGEQVGQGLEL